MLRFLSRFLGFWLIAAALVAAIVDGAKSIAASAVVLTPLAESLAMIGAGGPADAGAASAPPPWPIDIVLASLLNAPTVAVLAAPGLFFLIAGAKRRRAQFGREYAA
jgi:hypothetical protein